MCDPYAEFPGAEGRINRWSRDVLFIRAALFNPAPRLSHATKSGTCHSRSVPPAAIAEAPNRYQPPPPARAQRRGLGCTRIRPDHDNIFCYKRPSAESIVPTASKDPTCPVRRRLLSVYVRSVNEWCDAAENLNKWAGAKPTDFVLFHGTGGRSESTS